MRLRFALPILLTQHRIHANFQQNKFYLNGNLNFHELSQEAEKTD